jgi:DNA-binding SARP family transcriptional activator/tetratricopeptide (TPR) repeat protein
MREYGRTPSVPGQMAVTEPIHLQLTTFGVLSLTRGGSPVPGTGQQAKPLAMLAFLAAAGPRGATRDKVLGHIWPDLDTARARHSLKQTVYALRRDADQPRIITGSSVLRLDPEAVRADVLEFRRALSNGALEQAATIYTGQFLDGFFLEEEGPFQEWADRERGALAREYREALRTLGQRAPSGTGLGWWRRLVEEDPLDSSAVHGLMQALVAKGTPGEAIRVARDHAQILWRELEAAPDPAIMLLTEQIRSSFSPEVSPQGPGEPQPSAAPLPLPHREEKTLPPAVGSGKWGRTAFTGAAAACALLAALWLTHTGALPSSEPQASSQKTTVVIRPLAYQGPSSHAHLRRGVSEILRRNLETVAGLRPVDPRAVAAFDSLGGRGRGLELDGEMVEIAGRLRIEVDLHGAIRGREALRAKARAEGPLDSLFDITDRLSTELIAQIRPGSNPELMRSAAATTSFNAFAAYAEGEEHFLAGRYLDAVASFQKAIAEDTSFALAYYRLSIASDWASLTDLSPQAAEMAGRHASHLPEQERLLLAGYLAWRRGAADEAERTYRELLASHPDNVEAWFQLGEVLFHGNPFRGRSIGEARRPFERALNFEPGNVRAVSHLLRVAAVEGRWPELDSLLRTFPRTGHDGSEPWVELFRLRARGLRTVPDESLKRFRQLEDVLVYTAAERAAVYLDEPGMAEQVAQLLTDPHRSAGTRAYGHLTLAELALAQGRWRAAQAELAVAQSIDPGRGLAHRVLLSTTLFLSPDSAELSRLRQLLMRPPVRPSTPVSIYFSWQEIAPELLRTYLIGLTDARLRRDSSALKQAGALDGFSGTRENRGLAKALGHSLRAIVAWSENRPDDGLHALDQSRLETRLETARTPFGSESFERYLRGEFLRAIGDPSAALGWYRSMGENTVFDLIYLAPSLLQQGIIYERLGDRARAADLYSRVLKLWDGCDPALRSIRDEAERRLQLFGK